MSTTLSSTARKQRSPWWVLFGGGLASTVGPGPIVLATLGVFVLPITEETGFGRTTVTGAYSVAAVGMAIGLVIVGRLLDKFAVRYILVPGFTLFGVFTALVAITPPVEIIYLIPYFFLGFFGAGTAIPFTKAVVSWFDNKRALAIGIMASITGLGSSFAPLIAASFIGSFGWRPAYGLLALMSVTVSLIMILAFVRARAERHVRGRLVQETVENGREVSLEVPGLTFGEALRSRHFWQASIALGLVGVAVVGLQVHLVALMSDRGLEAGQAALLLTVFGLASLAGRLIGGFLIDRIHVTIVGPIVILVPVVGLFLLNPPFASAVFAVALIGVAYGIEGDIVPFTITRYLGTRHFGKIYGVVQSVFLLGTAFGPLLLGVGYDSFGSYDPIIPVLAGALVLSALLIALMGKYTYPAVKGFDKVAAEDELAAAEILAEVAESEDEGDPDKRADAARAKAEAPKV